jgi:hypothetical protein
MPSAFLFLIYPIFCAQTFLCHSCTVLNCFHVIYSRLKPSRGEERHAENILFCCAGPILFYDLLNWTLCENEATLEGCQAQVKGKIVFFSAAGEGVNKWNGISCAFLHLLCDECISTPF